MSRLATALALALCVGMSSGIAPMPGFGWVRGAQAQDKSDERARELAKLDVERDRELEKVRAEYDREIAGIERDAAKESDPAKAREKANREVAGSGASVSRGGHEDQRELL